MRQLFFAVSMLIVCSCTYAQSGTGQDTTKVRQLQSSYGFDYKNVGALYTFVPPKDTVKLRVADSGAIAFTSGRYWSWTGYRWDTLRASGSGGEVPPPVLYTAGRGLSLYANQFRLGGESDSTIFLNMQGENYVVDNADTISMGTLRSGSYGTALVEIAGQTKVLLQSAGAFQVDVGSIDASGTAAGQFGNKLAYGVNDVSISTVPIKLTPISSEPSGTNGYMYYNSSLGKFRVYENGSWKDLATGVVSANNGLSIEGGNIRLGQSSSTVGAPSLLSGSTIIPFNDLAATVLDLVSGAYPSTYTRLIPGAVAMFTDVTESGVYPQIYVTETSSGLQGVMKISSNSFDIQGPSGTSLSMTDDGKMLYGTFTDIGDYLHQFHGESNFDDTVHTSSFVKFRNDALPSEPPAFVGKDGYNFKATILSGTTEEGFVIDKGAGSGSVILSNNSSTGRDARFAASGTGILASHSFSGWQGFLQTNYTDKSVKLRTVDITSGGNDAFLNLFHQGPTNTAFTAGTNQDGFGFPETGFIAVGGSASMTAGPDASVTVAGETLEMTAGPFGRRRGIRVIATASSDTSFVYSENLSGFTHGFKIDSKFRIIDTAYKNADPNKVLTTDANGMFMLVTSPGGGGGGITGFTDGNGFDGTVTGSNLSLTTQLSTGSIPFIGASGALSQDNANLFWDNTNKRLGVGTTTPLHRFHSSVPASDGLAGIFERVGTSTNSISSIISVKNTTTGNMANEFGSALSFVIRDDAGVDNSVGVIGAVRAGADNTGAVVLGGVSSGTFSEAMRIFPTKNVSINTTASISNLQVNGATGIYSLNTSAYSSSGGGRLRVGNTGTPSAADQLIGSLTYSTNPAGTNLRTPATISAFSDGAWTDNSSHPTYLSFTTTSAGSALNIERMRITSSGDVVVNNGLRAGKTVISSVGTPTPLANDVFYVYRNESGNFNPLGAFEDDLPEGYVQFGLRGTGRTFHFGVGNNAETFFGVADKYFIYDNTSNAVRMVIDGAGNLGVNTVTPTAKLHVNGDTKIDGPLIVGRNVWTDIRTVTSSLTIDDTYHTVLIDASGGPVTVTLPSAASSYNSGKSLVFVFKRIDGSGNTITIAGGGSDTIDGSPTAGLNISPLMSMTIQSAGGTAWYITQN